MAFWYRLSRSPWLHRLLVLSLVASVWLGLVHRALHGGQPVVVAVPLAALDGGGQATALGLPEAKAWRGSTAHHHAAAGLPGLFGAHDDGTVECRLYDLLGHADLASLPLLALPPVLPLARVVHGLHGESLARWAALFDARGPPTVH